MYGVLQYLHTFYDEIMETIKANMTIVISRSQMAGMYLKTI